MDSLISKIEQAFSQGQLEEAFHGFSQFFSEFDPDDDDALEKMRELLTKGFGSAEPGAFVDLLEQLGMDFRILWLGKGGIALAFAESGCRDAGLFQRLVALGVDPAQSNREGNTILHLLSNRAKSNWDKQLAPFAAALILQTQNADVWLSPNAYGATPLHLAALCGHTEIIEAFLERGASPDLTGTNPNPGFSHALNFDRVTPLHLACSLGNEEVAGFLLEHGADAALTDAWGRTACFCAIAEPNKLFCPAYYNSIPSEEAVHERRCRIIRRLGAVDHADDKGTTPLLFALSVHRYDNGGYALLLLELGADPEQADNQGRTPLMAAAANNNRESLKRLVQAGVELNRQDANGDTALHLLLNSRDEKTARYLLKKGADFQIANNRGKTSLELAAEGGLNDVLEQML